MTFSIFKSSVIELGKRILKIEEFGVKTANECMPFGMDSNPIANMTAIHSITSNNSESVVIGYINKNQVAASGEMRLFSLGASGVQKTFLWLKANGKLELNGNMYSAVRYEPLNTGLQNQTQLINIELVKIQAALTALGGVYTHAPVTTYIANSKSDDVKLK